jgi:4-diphosphocytidyl-2C-methyl-D-erythritol kinase
MRVARVQAQAKINLMLQIFPTLDVRGYHELTTWFHRIDLADEIVVRAGGATRSLTCSGPAMPENGLGKPEDNLAFRAAVEFAQRASWPEGFSIEVTKHIPVGGGLGGGSADAGAVLRALNAIAPTPLPADEIWSAGCFLGSDVPFLASELSNAMGTGRGTQLGSERLGPLPNQHLLIVRPAFSIGTADAYRWLDEYRMRHGWNPFGELRDYMRIMQETQRAGPDAPAPEGDKRRILRLTLPNDFEPVIEERFSEIRIIRERLLELGAELAHLAGSGSCVWGIFRDTPPTTLDLDFAVQLIPTQLSSKVVQVEVLE